MPFIAREEIDPDLRAKHDSRYKAQLRKALHNAGLSAEARAHLHKQVQAVGKPKVYKADTPPKLGALSFPKWPNATEVRNMRKAELLQLAQQMGVDDTGNKPDVLERVLAVVGR